MNGGRGQIEKLGVESGLKFGKDIESGGRFKVRDGYKEGRERTKGGKKKKVGVYTELK